MNRSNLVLALSLSLLLTACQSVNSKNNLAIVLNEQLLNDQLFVNFQETVIESEQNIFALTPDIKLMVSEKLMPVTDPQKRAVTLLRQIFKNRDIGLIYSSSADLVAADAFHNNTANCLSLTIMAYALAKEAKLNMRFQQVDIPEFWVRNGRYNMLTGHVNLLLIAGKPLGTSVVYGRGNLQIDFDPYVAKKTFPAHIIDKKRVTAMFYNNKAAQAIVDNNYDSAYAYIKASVIADPSYSSGWGALGLLYRLTGNFDLAEQTYQYSLTLDKDNLTVLSNYAILLKMNGDIEAYNQINANLARKRQHNPYYQALLADEANYQGDYLTAIKFYKKAIRLNENVHEFYFELAKIYYHLQYLDKAKWAIRKAIALNRIPRIEHQYVAKLNFLKAEKPYSE
jgi:tetratricopeptide (TPR) repeat protein